MGLPVGHQSDIETAHRSRQGKVPETQRLARLGAGEVRTVLCGAGHVLQEFGEAGDKGPEAVSVPHPNSRTHPTRWGEEEAFPSRLLGRPR